MLHVPLNFPEITHGDWSIESFFQDGIHYQRLMHKGIVKMINTPEIVEDFEEFLLLAQGHVLINGLGMGMCNVDLLEKTTLKSLTVIEYDEELVFFIKPFFQHDNRCQIIHADAYLFEPPAGKIYDYVWHDVWTHQSVHNLKEIRQLKDKYKDISTWQGAWREAKCKEQLERETLMKLQVN